MARAKAAVDPVVVEAEGGRVLTGSGEPVDSTHTKAVTTHSSQLADAYAKRSVYMGKMVQRLTAAAEVMDPTKGEGPMPNAVSRTWQHAVYGYSRVVPELGVAAIYVGNCLSRCSLAVGKRNPDGSVEQGFMGDEPVEGLDGDIADSAADHIANLQSTRGGQSDLLRSFGEKDFLCGEAYLVPKDLPSGLRFECLSVNEIMKSGNKYSIYYGPGYAPEEVPEGVKPIRVWRPDSQYGRVATSSCRSCIEILEELAILTRLVRASAISRMALSGILAIAEEFDTPQNRAAADGQNSEEQVPFFVDMVNTGAKAIDDPASAAAWSPFLLVGPVELIQTGIRFISLQHDDANEIAHRDEALIRLAQGLDLPVEVIFGHQSTTYANAAQVSEDTFKLHIEPALERFCEALTIAYLWPAMAKEAGLTEEQVAAAGYPEAITAVAVTYDASKLISRPDRSALIARVFELDKTHMAIRLAEVREAIGLDPDQTPDSRETATRIDAVRLVGIRETIQAPPSDGAVSVESAAAGHATVPGESAGSSLIGGDTTEAGAVGALAAGSEMLAIMVSGAAELTVERAVERIGARLRTKARGAAEVAAIADVDNARVASILGAPAVKRILGRDAPAEAELRAFAAKVRQWATELDHVDPSAVAAAAVHLVAQRLAEQLYAEPEHRLAPASFAAATADVPS